jgi:hypothetical protein
MGTTELKTRIARFRQTYLDTPAGREILQSHLDEPKEVQTIYQALKQKREAGNDVTEEALKRLLPHSDTQGNRERGARVSTWPCITKDIKAWFEAAKWKQPSEWPAAVDWLFEIIDAGIREDWPAWRDLSQKPIQRGFACGFISPIIHCLNTTFPVINSKVVRTYEAVAKELGVKGEISSWLEEYPDNQCRVVEMVKQLAELGIENLVEWDVYCHWNVVKKLGGGETTIIVVPKVAEGVCKELEKAQHDTKNPDRFEAAIKAAFKVLGFEAEHIGGPGEADVVAEAMLGEDGFSLVIDAKTCQPGAPKGDIHYDALKSHQEQHEADYAIVIAPSFSKGATIDHAIKQGIGLLTTSQLIALVEESQQRAISLYRLKGLLGQKGSVNIDVSTQDQVWEDRMLAVRAVLDMLEKHQRVEASSGPVTTAAVFWLLKGTGKKLPEKLVADAIEFLSNPVLGVLEKRAEGYVLTTPANKAAVRIAAVSRGLTGPELQADAGLPCD